MSNIVFFCRQRIEIDAGTVTESSEPHRIGQFRFFVSYIDEEGGRLGLWDGPTHADAMTVARDCAKDFSAPIIDRSRRHA